MLSRRKPAVALSIATIAVLSAIVLAVFSFMGNKTMQTVTDPTGREMEGQPVAQLFRQGWGFFTRDAREDVIRVAHRSNGSWLVVEGNVTSAPDNMFGLSRKSRTFDQDVSFLLANVPAEASWRDCETMSDLDACVAPTAFEATATVQLNSSSPALCGDILLTRQAPTPYAFAGFDAEMPGAVLPLTITCGDSAHG